MAIWFKKNYPVLLTILFFIAITFVYCSPLLEGKVIIQSDVVSAQGMQQEVLNYKKTTGEPSLWTNSMFGGMPSYQIWLPYPNSIAGQVQAIYNKLIPDPARLILLLLLTSYLFFRIFKYNNWIAILGSIAIAFSSYNFVIIEAGHVNKVAAIAYLLPLLGGVMLVFRGKYWMGAAVTAIFAAFEVKANHVQMTYYFLIALLIFGIFELVTAIRNKTLPAFLKSTVIVLAAATLGIFTNISNLWVTYEYGEQTIRGKSELTLNKTPGDPVSGVSKEYAYQWSQGITESITFLIPDAYGGSSNHELGKDSEVAKEFKSKGVPMQNLKSMPTYWGNKPFTSGPVYFGAIICFLFVLGCFVVKGPTKWWLVTATLLSVLLCWGKNFELFSNIFFDYFPLYSKFRAVESILIVAGITVPLLGVLALQKIVIGEVQKQDLLKYLKYSLGIVGGVLLIFVVAPGIFLDFVSPNDKQFPEDVQKWLVPALEADRESLARSDAFRSLVFVLLSAGLLWAIIEKKILANYAAIALAVLVLVDMWGVNKRYLNDDAFVNKSKLKAQFAPRAVDEQILQDKDPNYRVYDASVNTFNSSSGSYYHKMVGGYHAAKLKKYQELIENQISKGNMSVFNMLNTRYFINKDQQSSQEIVQRNPGAMGNAWFVNEVEFAANADSEMNALTGFDPKSKAIVDVRYKAEVGNISLIKDSTANIKLSSYSPMELNYQAESKSGGFAVFSEIYYPAGWNAFVNGKPANIIRTNYVLRGLNLPAGKNEIKFKFEPNSYYTGEKIALVASILTVILLLAAIYFEFKNRNKLSATSV